jgi:hypothetical protein
VEPIKGSGENGMVVSRDDAGEIPSLTMHWHKIVALLMHEFEITQFEVTAGMLAAFKEEFGGKLPTVTYEESDGVFRVRLMTAEEIKRVVQ